MTDDERRRRCDALLHEHRRIVFKVAGVYARSAEDRRDLAQEIAWLLGKVRRKDFELKVDGLSSFGGRKPRALVAAVAPSQSVMELHAEHERLMQRVGLEPEGRKYTPHVTLARLRDSSSWDVADYLSARGWYRSAPFSVSRFVLFSARASVGGGPYVVEAAYPLAA